MTTKLKWRLGKLPTSNEVIELLKEKLISQEEAREILFNKESEDRDGDSLKEEIKFLRGLVEKLSNKSYTNVYEYIYKYPNPQPWTQPYITWCSGTKTWSLDNQSTFTTTSDNSLYLNNLVNSGANQLQTMYQGDNLAALNSVSVGPDVSFTEIKTF